MFKWRFPMRRANARAVVAVGSLEDHWGRRYVFGWDVEEQALLWLGSPEQDFGVEDLEWKAADKFVRATRHQIAQSFDPKEALARALSESQSLEVHPLHRMARPVMAKVRKYLGVSHSNPQTTFFHFSPADSFVFVAEPNAVEEYSPQRIDEEIRDLRARGERRVFVAVVSGPQDFCEQYMSELSEPELVVFSAPPEILQALSVEQIDKDFPETGKPVQIGDFLSSIPERLETLDWPDSPPAFTLWSQATPDLTEPSVPDQISENEDISEEAIFEQARAVMQQEISEEDEFPVDENDEAFKSGMKVREAVSGNLGQILEVKTTDFGKMASVRFDDDLDEVVLPLRDLESV